jgi:hypothetical protein
MEQRSLARLVNCFGLFVRHQNGDELVYALSSNQQAVSWWLWAVVHCTGKMGFSNGGHHWLWSTFWLRMISRAIQCFWQILQQTVSEEKSTANTIDLKGQCGAKRSSPCWVWHLHNQSEKLMIEDAIRNRWLLFESFAHAAPWTKLAYAKFHDFRETMGNIKKLWRCS